MARLNLAGLASLLALSLVLTACGDGATNTGATKTDGADEGAQPPATASSGAAGAPKAGPAAPAKDGDDREDAREIPGPAPAPEPRPAADEGPEVANPAVVGKRLETFALQGLGGGAFDLSKASYGRDDAIAALKSATQAFGADAAAFDLASKIGDLPGVKDDEGAVDEDKRAEFLTRAGAPFGLMAGAEQAEGVETLSQALDWLVGAKDHPMVFIVWSPKCPTCKKLNDRVHELAQESAVRMYAVAGNHGDTTDNMQKFRDNYGFSAPILLDPDQTVTNLLEGTRTPHFMLVDTAGVLRYRGAMDNDVQDLLEGDERKNYLKDAIAAVVSGGEIAEGETQPFG